MRKGVEGKAIWGKCYLELGLERKRSLCMSSGTWGESRHGHKHMQRP